MGTRNAKLSPAPEFDLGVVAAALTAENKPEGVGPFTKEFVSGALSQPFVNSLGPEDKADAALVLACELANWARTLDRQVALATSVAILDLAAFVTKTTKNPDRIAEAAKLRTTVRAMLPSRPEPAPSV